MNRRSVQTPEYAMAKVGLMVCAALALPAVATAGVLRGRDGAVTAALAIALVTVWLLVTALPLGWAARRGMTTVVAVAAGGYALRLAGLAVALVLLQPVRTIDGPVLAVTAAVAMVALLATEAGYTLRRSDLWWVTPEAPTDTGLGRAAPDDREERA